MEIWVAGNKEEAFSRIVAEDEAYQEGKKLVEKLKDVLPPEQFLLLCRQLSAAKWLPAKQLKPEGKTWQDICTEATSPVKENFWKNRKRQETDEAKGRVNVPPKLSLKFSEHKSIIR